MSDGKGIGSWRPHVVSGRNERQVGLERTPWVLRDSLAVVTNCLVFIYPLAWALYGWVDGVLLRGGESMGQWSLVAFLLHFPSALKS